MKWELACISHYVCSAFWPYQMNCVCLSPCCVITSPIFLKLIKMLFFTLEPEWSFLQQKDSSTMDKTISPQGPLFWSFLSYHVIFLSSCPVEQLSQLSPLNGEKKGNLDIYNSPTTGQTPSAGEDHVIWWRAAGQLLNRPCGEDILSTTVSKFKNDL